TTGSEGSIVLSLTKSGGTLNGYVDEIRVSETYNPMDIYMGTTEVKDENGTLVYAIHKGDMHIINGELVSSGEAGTVTATLRGIDGTGLVCEGTGGVYAVTAGGVQSFSLNTRAPLSDHAMFLLSLKDETGRTFSHTITNGDVLKQAEGETTLLLKDFAIRNMDGTLLMEPTCGEFNLFETALENKSDESIPMLGFMAIYKDGALFDLMYLNRNIDPNESDRFWLGTFMPEQGNITVKLFAWKSFADMNPLFEHALFETTN
ncbi:MAG: hypothetical protein IJB48_02085, partial [Clostridia bacterium]|nr:hypothetical protein [Clostridia bacterium]